MNEVLERTAEAIRRNGFEVHVFDTAAQAADFLDAEIDGKFVGLGDSMTLGAMGLYERLLAHNPKVLDPQQGKDHPEFDAIADACWNAEVFLTSVNALAETGEMVNIDGHGNRVAQSIHGHQKVYFVAGRNKIEPTLEAGAEYRGAGEREAPRIHDSVRSGGALLRLLAPGPHLQRPRGLSPSDDGDGGRGRADRRGYGAVGSFIPFFSQKHR